MTQQQADSVKDLAKPVVEVLLRITERECSFCKGTGEVGELIVHTISANKKIADGIYCDTCNGTGKVKWKWEPKWNDKVITDLGTVAQVTMIMPNGQIVLRDQLDKHFYGTQKDGEWLVSSNPFGEHIIPILHWEEIERVLERVGYPLSIEKYGCDIYRGEIVAHSIAKSRQSAVMKAVIKLGEEIHGTE